MDKSGLSGQFKASVYQHIILPRIIWPLLICEVLMRVVEGFGDKVIRYLRRWHGLRCLSSIGLYGNNRNLRLPFSIVREELIVIRA